MTILKLFRSWPLMTLSLHNRPGTGEDNVPGIEVVLDVLKSYLGLTLVFYFSRLLPRLPLDIQRIMIASVSPQASQLCVGGKKPPNWMFYLTDETGLLKSTKK